ncbi:MAG: DUF87 domain-containing protein [Pseudobdellovibrionaceae bacterium]|nr:MAG: DUF87 domain-containing protein [Pseudobdellovibrionaceae bacterium]
MTKSKTQNNFQNIDFHRLWKAISFIFLQPLLETVDGIKSKRTPIFHCLLASLVLQMGLIFRLDLFIYQRLDLEALYPSEGSALIYRMIITFFPLWAWGTYQVVLKFRLIKQLTEIFTNSGLKSLTGKLPSFIFDRPIDKFTRRMRLSKAGQSLQKFEGSKSDLESGLQVFIDEITENRKNGTIDIIYSHSQLEELFNLKDFDQIHSDSFLVGKGRSKQLFAKLEDTPHLLIAGQTGMGKSTFLRQLITSLYLKNKNYSLDLIDLKGGLEFQIFENLPRVKVKCNVKSSLGVLKNLAEKTIEERMELLKLNGCKDIAAFKKLDKNDIQYPSDRYLSVNFDRHVIVVDEAFDLFMVGAHATQEDVKKARRHSSKIAAQGRAVGVHIIIATQRPDRFALDPQTKSNLTGKVCFRLPNNASSMTVMDSKRAAELPNIKGRAIWQNSSDQFEIQTPFFSEDQAVQLLSQHYKKVKGKSTQTQRTQDINTDSEHGL